ncbi:uncharacterized protein LOC133884829 isoform X2 [Phragmites australis]|uniref:uncharacterized protein LOC133884829 isoform X2 n=1 Tax=Phragmites australis TaxID=29695 RepID=UPI002D7661BC|nr:uncharacterized protein LOC133884829 isoform X2 [Phragmites australis]
MIFSKGFSNIYQRSYGRSSYLLHGFRLAQILAFCVRDLWTLFSSEVHAKLTRTTLQGSCEDIGWFQRTKASLCSVDGTSRFKEILHEIRNGVHCLSDTLVYLFIPGLFSNHNPFYFINTKKFFSKMGLACHVAKIHSVVIELKRDSMQIFLVCLNTRFHSYFVLSREIADACAPYKLVFLSDLPCPSGSCSSYCTSVIISRN